MWVQCILCDRYVEIDDETTVAKHFKKRPDFAFLCSRCGGGLGHLEKNALPPGVRPGEGATAQREAEPTFAAWSEPKPLRERLARRSGGGGPVGMDRPQNRPVLPGTQRGGDRPRQEAEQPRREGDRPRGEDRPMQEGFQRHGQPGPGQLGRRGQPGRGHPGGRNAAGKPHRNPQQGGDNGPGHGIGNGAGQSGAPQQPGGGGRHRRRRGPRDHDGEHPPGGPTQAGPQAAQGQPQHPRPASMT